MRTVSSLFADGCQISHLKNKNLPIANLNFAVYPVRNLPSASEAFAIGKLLLCRHRQTFTLPTANKKFAVGKCAAGHRQNSCLINGKYKFCHRQIPIDFFLCIWYILRIVCGCHITAIISAFQAEDVGSTPIIRLFLSIF